MLITSREDRHQVAVLEDRILTEHYVAHSHSRSIVGNIYVGQVHAVLPGMEAAFINIGEARNAVLYAGEIAFEEELDGERPRIETVLKSGQTVLAQVTRDPMGSKGARLTTEISIPGRYLVLVPKAETLGASRRLPDPERKRLREIAEGIRPEGHGLIVRTAADGAGDRELQQDLTMLLDTWEEVSERAKKARPPKRIYSEPEMVIRVMRDLFTRDTESVIVDDQAVYKKVQKYLKNVSPELAERVELYQDSLALFERYHVIEQIRKALDRKVWLPSGGHIVIDKTEAMTVIDVNTGRYVGKSALEETVLRTNLEAAEEIAKQLKLRDIGGIIIIDFIDMVRDENRKQLLNTFKDALAKDRTNTQVLGISELGIVEMTRKNVSEGLLDAFSVVCEVCGGRGIIVTELDEEH